MISIIIVNYHQKKFIEGLLKSVSGAFSRLEYEIIISNNSPEEIFPQYEKIKVIDADNRGFGAANNLGAMHAAGEYLFILNPDTILLEGDYAGALKMLDEGAGALGFKLLNEDRSFQMSFGTDVSFCGERKNKKDEELQRAGDMAALKELDKKFNEIRKVDWVSGAAIMIKKDVFVKTGGFDENFFLYYEDADFCKRIREAGLDVLYYPRISIIHLKGENVKDNFRSSTYFYAKQSQLIYYRKHFGVFKNAILRIYLLIKFSVSCLLKKDSVDKEILNLIIHFSSSSSSSSKSSSS
ncbi:MAG TPA: glycosyltransferase family 2 protein [Ignavibacteria bacterium]|nr:glycosyltransferase family 2 protein [Ignavibacteria bacterium]